MKETLQASIRFFLLSVLILSNCAAALAYYHPEEGRFLSRDPMGEEYGLNLYRFAVNSPIMQFYADRLYKCATLENINFNNLPGPRGKCYLATCDGSGDGTSGLLCNGGRIDLDINAQWDSSTDRQKCIKPCVIKHEEVHRADFGQYPYEAVCKSREGQAPLFPQPDSYWKKLASELKAFPSEISCLTEMLGKKACQCIKKEIEERIKRQQGELKKTQDAYNKRY